MASLSASAEDSGDDGDGDSATALLARRRKRRSSADDALQQFLGGGATPEKIATPRGKRRRTPSPALQGMSSPLTPLEPAAEDTEAEATQTQDEGTGGVAPKPRRTPRRKGAKAKQLP